MIPISIRPMGGEDRNFILSAWLRSYRPFAFASEPHRCKECGDLPGWRDLAPSLRTDLFYRGHRRIVLGLLNRASVAVAYVPGMANQLMGFVCWAPRTLHYVYVKQPYRGLRVAARLMDHAQVTQVTPAVFTHRTYATEQHLASRLLDYNPYLAFEVPHGRKEDTDHETGS